MIHPVDDHDPHGKDTNRTWKSDVSLPDKEEHPDPSPNADKNSADSHYGSTAASPHGTFTR